MKPPDRAGVARALRRPRNAIMLALLALVLLARIALPYVLRPQIVEQVDKALVGRIALADIDLSLLRGGVELHGLELHATELPAPGEPAPEPLFEAKRLWVQISWLALLGKTIDVEEFDLDGFAVRLDRLADGLLLPKPAPSDAPPEPEPEPAEPSGWSYAAESVALRDGQITFTDRAVEKQPQRFDLAIRDLSAQDLALVIDPSGREPGRVAVKAQIGEGAVGVEAQVESRPAGPAAETKLTLENLPIEGVNVYLKMFGWSDLRGRLGATLVHKYETGGANELSGTVALTEVAVQVPDLERPALAWQKLAVTMERIDLVAQDARVAQVELLGARIVANAASNPPLPLLRPREDELPDVAASAATEPAPVTEATPAPAPEPEAEPSKPWTWGVGLVRIADTAVELDGGAETLPIGVGLELRDLSSERGSRWPIALRVNRDPGTLELDGALAIAPLAFDGRLAIRDWPLAPVLARSGVAAASLVRAGALRARLDLALAPRGDGTAATPPTDLRVAGMLGVAGLDVGAASTPDFGVAWKDFELGIRELALPEVLGAVDPAAARKIGASLELVRLDAPNIRVTRTAQGIVLPPPLGGPPAPADGAVAAEPAPAPVEPEPAADAPAASPAPEILVEIARAQIQAGKVQVVDRSVSPFYNGRIERLDLDARGIRWPGPVVKKLSFGLTGLAGAKLDARGSIVPGASTLRMKLDGLPLAPFNPYVTQTGYSLAGGKLDLETKLELDKEAYETETDVALHELEMGGAQGESLFQQNFGIPLSVALSLLKDLNGDIKLTVPVAGDRAGARVALGSIAGQALRKALMGALASPLKLLGAVTADGKVQSLAPEPIDFAPGTSDPAETGSARLEQLANLLAASPGIGLTLRGAIAAEDVRVLKERALLAELQATSGLRAIGQLGAIGTRRSVRGFLETKLAGGEPEPLDAESSAWLEQEIAARNADPAQLAELANARAGRARNLLVAGHGIAEERLSVGAPEIEPPPPQGGVAIALGSPSAAPPVSAPPAPQPATP